MDGFILLAVLGLLAYGAWRAVLHVCCPEVIMQEKELEFRKKQQRLENFKTGLGAAGLLFRIFGGR